MITGLLTFAILLVATFAGGANLRRTYRPAVQHSQRVGWVYATYQAVVAVLLTCAWLWWAGHPAWSVAAITWTACVPAHFIRAAKAARADDDDDDFPADDGRTPFELDLP